MRNRGMIRVLSIMEASSVTGPAKNLLAFAHQVRHWSDPAIDISVAVFRRPSRPHDGFLRALEAAQIPVRIIAEKRAGDPRIQPGHWRTPLFGAALLSATPLGGLAGWVLRRIAPRRQKPVPAAAGE
jgi:hypothetical protein